MEQEVNGILVAAHELKAPLSVLRQLALSFDFDQPDTTLEHIRSEMVSVSERAIKQVNDLSKISRLEDGLFVMEPVSVHAVCDDVTKELYYLFRYNKRDLFVKYYSGEETRSELCVKDCHDKVKISIRDFGPALPMDVWREMKRGWINKPTSIAMRPGSSGLGLYIASKFSRYMNANVGAVRHRDGTSFFVELPISTQARLF